MPLAIIFLSISCFLIALYFALYVHCHKNYKKAHDLLSKAEKLVIMKHGYGVFRLLKENGQEITYIVNHNTRKIVTTISYIDDPSSRVKAFIKARAVFDSYKDQNQVMSDEIYNQICRLLEPFEEELKFA